MAQVVLPNTITAGEAIEAAPIQANFEALRDGINSIDRTQIDEEEVHAGLIEDAAVTEAKLATGAATTTKIGAAAVTNAKVADGELRAAKFHSSVVVISHEEQELACATGVTVPFTFAGLDTSVFPQVTVLYASTDAAHWITSDVDIAKLEVVHSWSGSDYIVEVTQTIAASKQVKVIVTGPVA